MTMSTCPQKVTLANGSLRLLEITPANKASALGDLNGHMLRLRANGVSLTGFKASEIDFLAALQDIEVLRFVDCHRLRFSGFDACRRLRELHLDDTGRTQPIDFSGLRSLETIRFQWGGGVHGLDTLPNLENVGIKGVKAQSINDLRLPSRIARLTLQKCALQGFDGIESLGCLLYIKLWGMSSELDWCLLSSSPSLNCLDLERVPLKAGLDGLARCEKLAALYMLNCGVVSSLAWVGKLASLEHLSIFRTRLLDSDLSHLLNLKKLSWIDFKFRPRASMTVEELRLKLNIQV
jgi:hypothetical protein